MARRRRRNNHATTSQVKAIVKKEVGKTRENLRLVSYVSWSRMNDILVADGPTNAESVCCYSLTGALNPYEDATQDPNTQTNKNLFVLRPAVTQVGGGADVSQYGDGGTQSQMSAVGGVATRELSNIHNLEGKQCYLKKFYARVGLNNAVSTTQTTPRNCFVRCIVVETRRPLSSKSLSQQILLQSHGVAARNIGITPSQYPTTALGYLNREVIKKVYYDRLINLNAGAGATGSMKSFKLKINLNKKAHWKFYYETRDPAQVNQVVNYQGPFLYLIMWPSVSGAYGEIWDDDGIPAASCPTFSLSSILTFIDD